MNPKEIIDLIKSHNVSKDYLIKLSSHDNESVRGSAFKILAERFSNDVDATRLLRLAALEPRNSMPAMGTNTLAHLCIKLLATMTEPNARKVAEDLIDQWPINDRDNLDWFLSHG